VTSVFLLFIGNAKLVIKSVMTRFSGKNRRESTVLRDDKVHEIYAEIRAELGELTDVISRQYIYERIKMKTGLCTKTIAFILNHTIKRNLTNGG
jgi:hypothetical protein